MNLFIYYIFSIINIKGMFILKEIFLSVIIFFCGSYLISQDFSNHITQQLIINSPANAWSSLGYALPIAPIEVKFPLLTLSIASFSLWAKSTVTINFIDVTSIFWVIIIIPTYLLLKKRILTHLINVLFILYISFAVIFKYDDNILNFYSNNLIAITGTILSVSTGFLGFRYYKTKEFIIGASAILFGFGCKMCMIYLDQYWGTCVFHTTTAIGITCILHLVKEKPVLQPLLVTSYTNMV